MGRAFHGFDFLMVSRRGVYPFISLNIVTQSGRNPRITQKETSKTLVLVARSCMTLMLENLGGSSNLVSLENEKSAALQGCVFRTSRWSMHIWNWSHIWGGEEGGVWYRVSRIWYFYYPDVAQLNTINTTNTAWTAWNPNKLHNTGITRGCEL